MHNKSVTMTSMAISFTDTPASPLQILSEKLDVLRLAFYTAPVSCAALVPVFFLREVGTQLPLCSLRPGLLLWDRLALQQDAAPPSSLATPLGRLPVPAF